MFKHISSTQAMQIMAENQQARVLDVRTRAEWAEGIVPGALTINVMNPMFLSQLEPLDRKVPYLVICRSGARSQSACQAMTQMGFTDVSNISGGMMAWAGPIAEPKI
jgi:rhodanese-related sulfurtransferase